MTHNCLNNIEGIIWDLDNTLYRFTDDFKHHCNVAAAQAAVSMGLELSYQDCFKIAERSELEHGYSLHTYVTHHGLSYADLHFPFHEAINEDIISPIDGLIETIMALELPQVILTNASRCWAQRVLEKIGANDVFTKDKVIAMEDVNFEPKARSVKGFEMAIDLLNKDAEKILFVDDLDRNLIKAKEASLQTAYLHYGDQMHVLPNTIDYQFNDAKELLEAL